MSNVGIVVEALPCEGTDRCPSCSAKLPKYRCPNDATYMGIPKTYRRSLESVDPVLYCDKCFTKERTPEYAFYRLSRIVM